MKKVLNKIEKIAMPVLEKIHLKIFGHEMSDTMRRFLGNLSWSFVGGIISAGVMFVINIMAGRILGPEEYGKYGLVIAISSIFIIPMTFGLDTSAVHYISKAKTKKRKREYIGATQAIIVLIMPIIVGVLVLFKVQLASFLNTQVFVINVAVAFSILLTFKNITEAFIKGLHLFKFQAIVKIIEAVVVGNLFLVLFFKTIFTGFDIYIDIVGVGYIVYIGIMLIKIRRYLFFSVVRWRKLLFYGLYAVLGATSGILLASIDRLVLNNFSGVESVGIYSVYLLSSNVIFVQILSIFVAVFFPQLSAIEEKKHIVNKLNKLTLSIFWLIFLLSICTIVMTLFFLGKDYPFNWWYVILFSLGTAIASCYQLKMWFLNSTGIRGVRTTIKGTLAIGVINLMLNLILVPKFNIFGAIVATIISSTLLYLYFTNKINKKIV